MINTCSTVKYAPWTVDLDSSPFVCSLTGSLTSIDQSEGELDILKVRVYRDLGPQFPVGFSKSLNTCLRVKFRYLYLDKGMCSGKNNCHIVQIFYSFCALFTTNNKNSFVHYFSKSLTDHLILFISHSFQFKELITQQESKTRQIFPVVRVFLPQ